MSPCFFWTYRGSKGNLLRGQSNAVCINKIGWQFLKTARGFESPRHKLSRLETVKNRVNLGMTRGRYPFLPMISKTTQDIRTWTYLFSLSVTLKSIFRSEFSLNDTKAFKRKNHYRNGREVAKNNDSNNNKTLNLSITFYWITKINEQQIILSA